MNSLIAKCRQLVSRETMGSARKPFVAVLGGTVVLIGVAMIVLPGPAFLVIPLGLAILSAEFPWARRWLAKARSWLPHRKKAPPPKADQRDTAGSGGDR